MSQFVFARYGWMLVLVMLVALWLRVENLPLSLRAHAAPSEVNAAEAPLPPTTIAVVDIGKTYKGYRTFNDNMAKIHGEIAVFDAVVKAEVKTLTELGERLKLMPPESDARKQLQADVTARTTDLQSRVDLKKSDLLKSESELYYDSYRKVEAAVRIVARKKKIGFVLRFNSEDMKREDRNSILQGVNRAVVTYPAENDITTLVLDELNRS